jgi:hypothetical protein
VDKSLWFCGFPNFLTLSELRNPGCRYLSSDGTLKMRIRLVQFGEILECKQETEEELKGLKDRTGDKLRQDVGTLLDSQALSDLQIKTSDGKLFQAHKLILGGSFCIVFSHTRNSHHHNIAFLSFNDPLVARSPVFLKMFETKMKETGEGVLTIEDMSGEAMEQLLKHIYTGSVDKLNNLKVDVVLELVNASNKV